MINIKNIERRKGVSKFLSKAKGAAKRGYSKYKKYKKDAPKREAKKLRDLEMQEKQYAVRSKIAKHKRSMNKGKGGGGSFPIRFTTGAERQAMGSSYDFGIGSSSLAIKNTENFARKARKRITKKVKKARKRVTKGVKNTRRGF